MKVRRRHAWGAVLIVLFALPVLKPEGIEALERPVGSFFAWFSRVPALNPRLWGDDDVVADGEGGGPQAQALAEENAVLRELFARRLLLEEDLRDLKGALDALQNDGLDRLPRVQGARVLRVNDASGFRRSILIDRGAQDGLQVGMAVVSGRVLVGRIEVVHARSAFVKLVTDRRSRLEVALRTNKKVRLTGFVRGEGRGTEEGELDLRFLVVPDDVGWVEVGTAVLTSNADPLVPAGLIVGYVTDVYDKDLDGIPRVRLSPALDLQRSTRVFVLFPD